MKKHLVQFLSYLLWKLDPVAMTGIRIHANHVSADLSGHIRPDRWSHVSITFSSMLRANGKSDRTKDFKSYVTSEIV